jgi:hypothetical protein
MRKSTLFHLLMLLTLIFVPAFGEAYSGKDINARLKNEPVAEPNPAHNDAALYIAGISNQQGTLAAYENQPVWARYARFISQSWERFEERHLAPMRAWASKELSTANTATVFYPFSGPDFVNMYTLLPHAKTYLMTL